VADLGAARKHDDGAALASWDGLPRHSVKKMANNEQIVANPSNGRPSTLLLRVKEIATRFEQPAGVVRAQRVPLFSPR
jgi:hypothetical protein